MRLNAVVRVVRRVRRVVRDGNGMLTGKTKGRGCLCQHSEFWERGLVLRDGMMPVQR